MEIAVAGRKDFILGFSLAGVLNTVELSKDQMKDIREMLKDRSLGILVLEEEAIAGLSEADKEKIERSVQPVAISLSKGAGNEALREIIIKSIGVDLWGKDEVGKDEAER
ncbi:MAG TPA: V-type ATP synthase subunit F [Candidatus Nanoarchaeia archaeon]|nr:V-type ATP synthase subunit F [Candidatus Nanoarchaeia archaeon]